MTTRADSPSVPAATSPAPPPTDVLPAAGDAPAGRLQVFGFRHLPREAVRDRLAALFHLVFSDEDSLAFGPFATAYPAPDELWRLFGNFNGLENAWLEDDHRHCAVILYIAGSSDTRAAELRQRLLRDFPTAEHLRSETAA